MEENTSLKTSPRLLLSSRVRLFFYMCILTTIANLPSAFTHTSVNTAVQELNSYLNESYSARGLQLDESHISVLRSALNCIWYVGQVVGALGSPVICDKYGRKAAFIVSSALVTVGAIMQSASIHVLAPELFVLGRVVAAIAAPLMDAALIVYLQECAPRTIRGSMSSLFSTGYAVTCLFGMFLGHDYVLGKNLRQLLFIPCITGVLSTLFLFAIPETPKFLAIKRRNVVAAQRSIHFFLGDGVPADAEDELLQEHSLNSSKDGGIWALWTDAALRLSTALALSALVFTLPFYPILQSSTYIFLSVGAGKSTAQTASTCLMIIFTLACIVSTSVIDFFPRKTFLLAAGLMSFCLLLLYPVCKLVFDLPIITILLSCGYVLVYGVGVGPLAWTIGPELVPLNYRSALFCACYAIHSLLLVASNFTVIVMFDAIGLLAIPALYVGPVVGATVLLWLRLPETNDNTKK